MPSITFVSLQTNTDMKTSTYEQTATDFLTRNGIEFSTEFIKHDFHFDGDKDKRDIYKVTFSRNGKKFILDFGQSINNSGFYAMYSRSKIELDRAWIKLNKWDLMTRIKWSTKASDFGGVKADSIHYPITPTAYDVIACLTKYDPIDFENFCSEYGYDTDSRKAKKTYKAVDKEYTNVIKFFTPQEIEEMQEIH